MKIFFEYLGLLHIEGVKNKTFLDVDAGTTIAGLFGQLKIRREHQKFISVFINDIEKPRTTILNENDRVKFFLPTGGG